MVVIDGVEILEPNNRVLSYTDTDWKSMNITDWIQFCKANTEFREPGITYDELRALHEACELLGQRPLRIVETGMCYGTTTRYFAVRVAKYGGDIHTYEINVRDMFREYMLGLGLWDYITVHGHSITDEYDGKSIDLLWIDSEHALQDALCEYIRFRPYFYENTLIGFHDSDICAGVAMAINVIQEMDELEQVAYSGDRLSSGCRIFKRKNPNRTNRWWHGMKGYEICQVPLKDPKIQDTNQSLETLQKEPLLQNVSPEPRECLGKSEIVEDVPEQITATNSTPAIPIVVTNTSPSTPLEEAKIEPDPSSSPPLFRPIMPNQMPSSPKTTQ